MKFNERYNISQEAQGLFSFDSKQDEYEYGANRLMFKFLSEIEKLNEESKLKRKELAALLGTSASYITQLYRGDKLINLLTLAKLEDVFNIEFEIKTKHLKQHSVSVTVSMNPTNDLGRKDDFKSEPFICDTKPTISSEQIEFSQAA